MKQIQENRYSISGKTDYERSANIGYTHYYSVSNWTSKDTEGYEKALPILKKIAEKYMSIIQYECEEDREPQVDYRGIHLNGDAEDGHETFAFKLREVSREFCKTARKPYDLPVCEMLLVLKAYLPNFVLSSDGFSGYAEEPKIDGFWKQAIENVKEYGIHYTIKVESQGPGREKYVNITPVFDKFVNAVAAAMKKTKKAGKKELLAALLEIEERTRPNGDMADQAVNAIARKVLFNT